MTGRELIQFIKENDAEDYEIMVYDNDGWECFLEFPEINSKRNVIYLES